VKRRRLFIALAENRTYDEIPAIAVIAGGGWSKRAHKNSYNARYSKECLLIGFYSKIDLYSQPT